MELSSLTSLLDAYLENNDISATSESQFFQNISFIVKAATTANITRTLAATPVIDGVVLQVGDIVLVKNQNTPSQNGVFVVSLSGVWTRHPEFPTSELDNDTIFSVQFGTVNSGTIWTRVLPLVNYTYKQVETLSTPTFGFPAQGLGIDITQEFGGYDFVGATAPIAPPVGFTAGMTWLDTSTIPPTTRIRSASTWQVQSAAPSAGNRAELVASTSITATASVMLTANYSAFDSGGFDSDGLDAVSDATTILMAPSAPPVPSPTPALTSFSAIQTPLYASIPSRVFILSFPVDVAVTPTVRIWTAGAPSSSIVPVVERTNARSFTFTIGPEAETKVIVT